MHPSHNHLKIKHTSVSVSDIEACLLNDYLIKRLADPTSVIILMMNSSSYVAYRDSNDKG